MGVIELAIVIDRWNYFSFYTIHAETYMHPQSTYIHICSPISVASKKGDFYLVGSRKPVSGLNSNPISKCPGTECTTSYVYTLHMIWSIDNVCSTTYDIDI